MSSIPLVDLSAQHAAVATEVADGWRRVLADTAFIGGPQVAAFEDEYAAFRFGEIVRPQTLEGNEHVGHLYVVRVRDRDRVLKELHAAGIGVGIHYPIPIHLTRAFAGLGYAEGAFPVAERNARELLSLPLFAEITVEQQESVVSVLKVALR